MSGFRTELAGPLAAVIIQSAVDAIVVIDAQGRIEVFNPAAERLFGYAEAEVIGRNVSMLMPVPYRDEHDGYLKRYLDEGDARVIGIGREVQGLKRDGTMFPLHLSVGEMLVEGQRKFTGILHDLSSRVELESRLRSSEARWRAIVESAVDAIIVIDGRGHIEAFNPAAERLFGYPEGEAVGQNVSLLMPSPYRDEHDSYLERYQREGSARIIGIGREVPAGAATERSFHYTSQSERCWLAGDRKFVGMLHDLSVRKRIEQQLSEQQSLAKIGEMAAVLAHEIRNPLAGIRGAMQVMAARYEPGSKEGDGHQGDHRPGRYAQRADAGPAALRASTQATPGSGRSETADPDDPRTAQPRSRRERRPGERRGIRAARAR